MLLRLLLSYLVFLLSEPVHAISDKMKERSTHSIAQGPVELRIRPDVIAVVESRGLPAQLTLVERLDGSSLLHTSVDGLDHLLTIELPGTYQGWPGENLKLKIDPERVQVFDASGQSMR